MGRVHNIVFIIVFGIVCCAVLGNIAWSDLVGADEGPVTSALEGRNFELIPVPSTESVQDGEYQSSMEQALADKIPWREKVLLSNARVQRSVVRAANIPFGFSAYPTFFGSGYAFSPSSQAVYQLPASRDAFSSEFFDRAGAAIDNLVTSYPDFNWVYLLPDRANISVASPLHGLAGSAVDYPLAISELERVLPSSCRVATCSYDDSEEYAFKFFRTDHHMQAEGALDFYSALVRSFGKEPTDFGATQKVIDDEFYGANARAGLYDGVSDELRDVLYDPQGLTAKINGEDAPLYRLCNSMDPDVARGYSKSERFANIYGEWYGWDYPVIEISNSNPDVAGESLLLLGDSFDNNQLYLYASNYEHVYSVDPRYYEGGHRRSHWLVSGYHRCRDYHFAR